MKILHTADWHLGNVFHGHDRTEEHRHFLDWLLTVLEERKPDALLVAGDIFDSPNPSAAAERLFYDFLRQATAAVEGLQVVLVAGNHDSAGRLEAPASLLSTHNVHVRGIVRRLDDGQPDFSHFLIPLSERGAATPAAICLALPYLRPAECPDGSMADGLRSFFAEFSRMAGQKELRQLPRIAVAHFYAAGSEICAEGHSERLVVGGQDCVDPAVAGKGLAYVALGHIHKQQRVAPGIHYAGSALPMSFAERGYRHGALWVDIADGGEAHVVGIGYSPLRGLLTVPSRGAASAAELPALLAALPPREKGDDGREWPYLEIRVEEAQPDPTLMQSVAEALEDRAVHFCRMVRVVPAAEAAAEARLDSIETLRTLSPLEMAQRVFANRYHAPMPPELESRFRQAEEEATQEP